MKKFKEITEAETKKYDEIPAYPMGEIPDGMEDADPGLFRVILAKRALSASYEDDGIAAITDMLSDLRHLCDRIGVDFADLDRVAYGHYAEEKGEWKSAEEAPASLAPKGQ